MSVSGSWLRERAVDPAGARWLETAAMTLAVSGSGVALGGARLVGFALVAAGVAGLRALLAVTRSEWGARDERARQLVMRHCDDLEKKHGRKWAVKAWRQDVDILPNGDARQRIAFTIVARCAELDFCSFTDRVNWDWPARFKRRVQVHVRSVEVGGEGGTRFRATWVWLDDKRLKTFIHLDQPVLRDAEVSFVVDLLWPAKFAPLLLGRTPDEVLVSFGERITSAQYVITFPAGCRVRVDKLGLGPDDRYVLTHVWGPTGRPEVALSFEGIEAYRKVGLKIDLA
nr:hypothetical protein GCM10017745_08600 [Saccharothrix mutabilis subsp. capreolus]